MEYIGFITKGLGRGFGSEQYWILRVYLADYQVNKDEYVLSMPQELICTDEKDAEFEFYDKWSPGYIIPQYLLSHVHPSLIP